MKCISSYRFFLFLLLFSCLFLLFGCKITRPTISIECEGSEEGIEKWKVETKVKVDFSEAPYRKAQFAVLVPITWSGISTETQTPDGDPFVEGGTIIEWIKSSEVAEKAERMRPSPDVSFAWVGFESNQFTPDSSITDREFVQLLEFDFAPVEDLDGAEGILVFAGDSIGENDRFRSLPTICPVTFIVCDIDGDEDVDIDDISDILTARNTMTELGDPRDVDGDKEITVRDAKICIPQCTNPRCAQ